MKHISLFFAFFLASQAVFAQEIAVNNTFGQNGKTRTLVKVGSYGHSTFMDLTPDQRIVTLSTEYTGDQPFFCKYSTQGEHLQSIEYQAQAGVNFQASAIKALEDGRYLVATSDGLMRFSADGSVDPTFGINGKADLYGIYIQDIVISRNNRILAVGEALSTPSTLGDGGFVLAFDMEGNPDLSYGNSGIFHFHQFIWEFFNHAVEQPDGKLLIAGCYASGPGMANVLLRVLPEGALDHSFGVNGLTVASDSDDGENYKVLLQSDGKILTCGDGENVTMGAVSRFLPTGERDLSFGLNGIVSLPMIKSAFDVISLPDGNALVYGKATGGNIIVRLLPNGLLDPFFGTGGSYLVPTINSAWSLKLNLVENNKLIATSGEFESSNASHYLTMFGFILDLNVGAVSPNNNSTVWTYPNPVSDAAEVKFSLEQAADLQFELYDLQGKRIQTLVEKTAFESGEHQQTIHLPQAPAGNYFLQLTAEGKPLTTVRITKI